ncbi:hypothetical protein [Flavobacterium sp.]|uniref:hypothetical protein n=1 Tax=Flavobacterium sp. TaxID=239 RepID=UPI00262A2730|nr:hypothetical protein [Flavobacterium sp.]
MKNLFIIITFIFLNSFTIKSESNVLPDGHYSAILDDEFKKKELNDFEFLIQNGKFTIKIDDKFEALEMEWLDENSFVVKGYTEPKSPNEFEKKLLKDNRPTFNIVKNVDNEYYFTLGQESDKSPIISGKFIKSLNSK